MRYTRSNIALDMHVLARYAHSFISIIFDFIVVLVYVDGVQYIYVQQILSHAFFSRI